MDRHSMTKYIKADIEIFKEIKYEWKRIVTHLRQQAYLKPLTGQTGETVRDWGMLSNNQIEI